MIQTRNDFADVQDAFTNLGGGGTTDIQTPKDPKEEDNSEDNDANQENEECSQHS